METSTFIWIFIVVMYSIVLVGIDLFLIIKFRNDIKGWLKRRMNRSRYLHSYILKPNFQLITHHTVIQDDMTFEYGDGSYMVNPMLLIWRKGIPISFHLEGNPNPADFRHMFGNDHAGVINAENFDRIKKQKIIKDLTTEEKMFKILIVLMIVIIIMLLAVIAKVFGLLDKLTG